MGTAILIYFAGHNQCRDKSHQSLAPRCDVRVFSLFRLQTNEVMIFFVINISVAGAGAWVIYKSYERLHGVEGRVFGFDRGGMRSVLSL